MSYVNPFALGFKTASQRYFINSVSPSYHSVDGSVKIHPQQTVTQFWDQFSEVIRGAINQCSLKETPLRLIISFDDHVLTHILPAGFLLAKEELEGFIRPLVAHIFKLAVTRTANQPFLVLRVNLSLGIPGVVKQTYAEVVKAPAK